MQRLLTQSCDVPWYACSQGRGAVASLGVWWRKLPDDGSGEDNGGPAYVWRRRTALGNMQLLLLRWRWKPHNRLTCLWRALNYTSAASGTPVRWCNGASWQLLMRLRALLLPGSACMCTSLEQHTSLFYRTSAISLSEAGGCDVTPFRAESAGNLQNLLGGYFVHVPCLHHRSTCKDASVRYSVSV